MVSKAESEAACVPMVLDCVARRVWKPIAVGGVAQWLAAFVA